MYFIFDMMCNKFCLLWCYRRFIKTVNNFEMYTFFCLKAKKFLYLESLHMRYLKMVYEYISLAGGMCYA